MLFTGSADINLFVLPENFSVRFFAGFWLDSVALTLTGSKDPSDERPAPGP